MRLSDFRVLTFDCYGTLIDWESGLWAALRPIAERAGVLREDALEAFAASESRQERETPGMKYSEVLERVHRRLAQRWGVSTARDADLRFGASVKDWPAFPDTAATLRRLQHFYRLVILSNVDRAGFAGSLPRLGIDFDAVFTAEDVGSYKPNPRNFAYLLERLDQMGFARSGVLHTAQSLYHDHAPANAAGLASCWIDRRAGAAGWGATTPAAPDVRWDFRFSTLAEMAEARAAEGE